MILSVAGRTLEFLPVPLKFVNGLRVEVFAEKNNKTVRETLLRPKYSKLSELAHARYSASMERPLGEFLLDLKLAGNLLYKRFLNRYGDDAYCEFSIDDRHLSGLIGLYCFVLEDEIKYIGKSTDSFKKRINQGYGRIHPKNCYRDGQATNCHLNALIASCRDKVRFFAYPMDNITEIESLERELIYRENPEWNIQLKRLL